MKAGIFFSFFALAASALATPIAAGNQLESQAAQIDQLTTLVRQHTANMNATAAQYPENPTLAQQQDAADKLKPDFEAVTNALTQATTTLSKREFWTELAARGGAGFCDDDCLKVKIQVLILEITYTVKFLIVKLGLGCLIPLLTPLLLALSGLLRSLDKVVGGVLVLVGGLLHAVLGGLAGGLLGLIGF
ncbi:hypothetical protein NEUTE1DRAFT_124565 [Neurospora tetrasperma FGSC 2508]|uniref:Uncharacterized protein n=1 Tax=Neurospora tetrasperma (strain FGSC 2508 / ATCC MYA-4615 / P0657) TaxID=510951 RepID=F8MX13_NEUT8|nr:uncharacterized protein NEUTE1DRAFT_124565 [Neurospora tetrasperma FGSC 2508]EGO54284.1 hypothetical protein NEUTE1DRAFT_124565 [Neurospora tetrasperma FGSC 2508]EGZ68280.1 hypothetical protein NEUTE2DRAFT_118005 [Neurospora tetrasperma FGSC 2509]